MMAGMVSHMETECFWLQREPDKVARLCEGEVVVEKGGTMLCVGESVGGSGLGWREVDWYRGVVMELLGEGR